MSIRAEHLNHIYGEGTAFEQYALKDVNLTIHDGEFIGLIGHTGSGKSTLTQHLNGLLKATSGDILYNGESIYKEGYSMKEIGKLLGLPAPTVGTRLARGRERLRQLLKEDEA